jgi:formylglycine-generating enzyme
MDETSTGGEGGGGGATICSDVTIAETGRHEEKMSRRRRLRTGWVIAGLALSFRAHAEGRDSPKIPALADDAGCPVGMVLVAGESCWDVRHTCLAEVEDDPAHRCLEFAVGKDVCVPPKKPLRFCMDRYEWPGTPGAKPRVMASYFEAEKACRSVGKRMCEEQEFYLACEGPEHWPFAWGHVRHPSTCNIDRPYLTVDWKKWGQGGDPRVEEARRLDQALPVGTTRCFSPYGVHDIAGNVDEWTHAQQGRELLGSLNGGYWGPVANACRYVTLVHGPEFSFYQIGFRCCLDAP